MVADPNPAGAPVDFTAAQHAYINLRAAIQATASVAAARALDPTAYPYAGPDPIRVLANEAFSDLIMAGFQPEGWEGEWWKYTARNGRLA